MKTVVIHTEHVADAVAFFEALGLSFSEERHGAGAIHFAHQSVAGLVFEIYPLTVAWPNEGLHIVDGE